MGEFAGWAAAGVSLMALAAVLTRDWQIDRRIRDQWLAVTEAVGDLEHRLRKLEATVAALQAVPVVTAVHPITGQPSVRSIGESLSRRGEWVNGHGG
jgi:uncharacterized membrane protein